MKTTTLAIVIATLLTLTGCKTNHHATIVNAKAEFDSHVEWQLTLMKGKQVNYEEGQEPVYIQFFPESHDFSGTAGCNRYFGTYREGADGKITLSEVANTRMMCPETFMRVERTYLALLSKVDGYHLDAYQLELLQGDKVLLTFERDNP